MKLWYKLLSYGLFLFEPPSVYFNYNPKHKRTSSSEYTKKYFDNHQKAKRNRPYYGHRNHKYIINHKNRV